MNRVHQDYLQLILNQTFFKVDGAGNVYRPIVVLDNGIRLKFNILENYPLSPPKVFISDISEEEERKDWNVSGAWISSDTLLSYLTRIYSLLKKEEFTEDLHLVKL